MQLNNLPQKQVGGQKLIKMQTSPAGWVTEFIRGYLQTVGDLQAAAPQELPISPVPGYCFGDY